MRYPLVCVLALALGVVGCNETSGENGSGGAAGAGGFEPRACQPGSPRVLSVAVWVQGEGSRGS